MLLLQKYKGSKCSQTSSAMRNSKQPLDHSTLTISLAKAAMASCIRYTAALMRKIYFSVLKVLNIYNCTFFLISDLGD